MLSKPPPGKLVKKIWKPKCPNLPILESYSKTLPASYWMNWNKLAFEQALPTSSWVSSKMLKELSYIAGYQDSNRLERVCKRLDQGADIGCRGRGRLPTVSPNAISAYEYGARVADSLQD